MTQADVPLPEIGLLAPNQICLLHNIRDDNGLDDDFIASIQAQGILNRVTVRRVLCEHDLQYVAVAGHRRIAAEAVARGEDSVTVPVEIISQVRELDVVFMLVENLQRKDIGPLEEARGYAELVREHHWSQAEVAASVGMSRSHVSERIQLLGLPEAAKAQLADGSLPIRAALLLAKEPLDVVEKILKSPGPKNEQWIRSDIENVKKDLARKVSVDKLVAEYERQGWATHRKAPTGAHRVRLTDEKVDQWAPGFKLNLTVAKFKKEPGACVVVLPASNYRDTDAKVSYYTTDFARYQDDGANAAAVVFDDTASPDELLSDGQRAAILEHRRQWFRTFVRTKPENKVVLDALIPVLWRSLVEREAVEMATALGLITEGEDADDHQLAEQRLRDYIVGKKAAEQLRLCYLARYVVDLRNGLARYADPDVPRSLLDAGYEPTEEEAAVLALFRAALAQEWTDYRTAIVDSYSEIADAAEMEAFLAKATELQNLDVSPDDIYDDPFLCAQLDAWETAEADAEAAEPEIVDVETDAV